MSSVTSHQACIEIHPPALYKAEHSSGKYSRFSQEITGERPYCGEEGFKIQNQNNYTSFIDVCIVDPSADRVVSRTPTETKTYRFNEGRHASASLPHAFYSNPYTGPIKKAQKSPIAVLTSFFQYIIIKVSSYNRDFLLDRRYTFPADPAHH